MLSTSEVAGLLLASGMSSGGLVLACCLLASGWGVLNSSCALLGASCGLPGCGCALPGSVWALLGSGCGLLGAGCGLLGCGCGLPASSCGLPGCSCGPCGLGPGCVAWLGREGAEALVLPASELSSPSLRVGLSTVDALLNSGGAALLGAGGFEAGAGTMLDSTGLLESRDDGTLGDAGGDWAWLETGGFALLSSDGSGWVRSDAAALLGSGAVVLLFSGATAEFDPAGGRSTLRWAALLLSSLARSLLGPGLPTPGAVLGSS